MTSIWYYIISAILLIVTFAIVGLTTLKICEKNDYRKSMWLICPITIGLLIIIVIPLFLLIKNIPVAVLLSVPLIGSSLGLVFGMSYYNNRNRIEFKRKKGLL